MPKRSGKRRTNGEQDPLAAYRRVRKRLAPPARVDPDRREKLRERADRTDRGTEDAEQNLGREEA